MTKRADTALWRRAWELSEPAAEVPSRELDAWLTEQCAGDPALVAAVRQLLGSSEVERAPEPDETAPRSIGPYDIEALIGSGGMGEVYRGRHRELGQIAAVKVLRHGLTAPGDTGSIERFQREMRLLVRLRHPGIVSIYEAGHGADDATGKISWFAMELIEDPRTVTEYARQRTLSGAEFLDLCLELSVAIGHAHEHGVAHRDLKPSNLLVDASGHVRVIDFGVGRVLEPGEGSTNLTIEGAVVGTLNYLAPECLAGKSADERSDVYGLGLVLEELVLGTPRFEFSPTPFGIQALQDAQQHPPPPLLRSAVPLEFSSIVAKATEPGPNRRYANAGEVAEDLRRLIGSKPISARPVGPAHRARLFAVRNRGFVKAIAAVFVALVIGLIGTSLALVRESKALTREQAAKLRAQDALGRESLAKAAAEASALSANRESQANEAFTRFIQGAFERAPAGVPYTVEQALENALDQLEVEGDSLLRARVFQLLGSTFAARGVWPRADQLLTESVAAFEAAGEVWSEDWASAVKLLHGAKTRQGLFDDAEALEAVVRRGPRDEQEAATRRIQALMRLAINQFNVSREDRAVALFEVLVADADMTYPPQRDLALSARANIATCMSWGGDLELAKENLLEVWTWRSEHQPEEPRTYRSAKMIAEYDLVLGRAVEALEFVSAAIDLAEKNGLAKSLDTLDLRETKAKALSRLGQKDEALALLETCLADRRSLSGDRDGDILVLRDNIALTLAQLGRYERAREMNEGTYLLRSEEQGPEHPKTLFTLAQLGSSLYQLGRSTEALAVLEEARDGLMLHGDPLHPDTVFVRGKVVECLAKEGRLEAALETQTRLVDELVAADATPPEHLASQFEQLGILHRESGDWSVALQHGERAVEILEQVGSPGISLIQVRMNLARTLLAGQQSAAARAQLAAAEREASRVEGAGGSTTALMQEFRSLFPVEGATGE